MQKAALAITKVFWTCILADDFNRQEYNGMLYHSFGRAVIFPSLQHFIALALDLITCLPC